MSQTSVLTPWQDESELAMVRDWFFPGQSKKDPYDTETRQDMRKEAIAKVNVWTFKSHKVPPAVVSTADLTDSILHYEELNRSGGIQSYRAVQFMFAFAFLRFVNSFVDRDVARAATANLATSDDDVEDEKAVRVTGESSMYAHAAAIAMPSRFVDLRHQVSHGAVPEIKTLKKAGDEALTWLWQRWWKLNATGDPSPAWKLFKARREQRLHHAHQPDGP